MRSLNRWGWNGVLLLLSAVATCVTACSAQPSAEQLTKELETVASWTATAHMVGEAWLKQSVPTVYASQTLETVQEEFGKEAETVAKVAPAQDRTKAQTQLRGIEQTVDEMTKAVEHDDRPTLTQRLQKLSAQEQALTDWIKATGGQP